MPQTFPMSAVEWDSPRCASQFPARKGKAAYALRSQSGSLDEFQNADGGAVEILIQGFPWGGCVHQASAPVSSGAPFGGLRKG